MNVATEAVDAVADHKAKSLYAIVQREIERMILGGELASGQRLNEQHLASRLGVSRGPVREALRSLERAGLVTAVANLGMFVRQMDVEEVLELYEMRGLVFGFACMRVAGELSGEQQEALRDLILEMDEVIAREDGAEYYRLNLQFHDLVMEYAGHGQATRIYESLVKEAHLVRAKTLRPVTSMQASNSEHKVIFEAIVAGDRTAARTVAEEHHFYGKNRWLDTLRR